MDLPPFLKPAADGVLISLKVQPRASRNEIGDVLGSELRVKVSAPPVDSAANEAVVRLIAETLNVPRNRVELVRGQTSRHKAVRISGLSPTAVATRLGGP